MHASKIPERRARLFGVRVAWTAVGDGEFFCPGCGGDRNYQRMTGRRRLAVVGLPLLPRGTAGPVVACADCEGHFTTDVLDHPTTRKFAAMLRDSVHTVALAVLFAGGTESRTALETAACAVRAAGFEDCTDEQLAALVEGLAADTGRMAGASTDAPSVTLGIELHEALDPIAPHLAQPGRESILLQGARIALADGPYTPAEHEVLTTVGAALDIDTGEVTRLLTQARTPS
ncbi:hypothetical protein B1H18_10795 [Streptomyces tsukubensis]|uniref:Co-chaperone DjlA N-terminal domain-containing protein n=1 Tax=Streptomyces tsukubensis TaxID=83656 RepID=A0A1V4AC58_9ACTN|nr:hypothetical protein B1H18_10795 [Streptomyces tsukubensis]